MGFYDCRCMVTGVSLKGADTALVLLQQEDDVYFPIALAMKGNYNRLGSIDGIEEDVNTKAVLRFFLESLRDRTFVVEEDYLRSHECFPIETIGMLLQGFERNVNDLSRAALLNGKPVVFALICEAVWNALAKANPASRKSAQSVFRQLFKGTPVAEKIYGEALEKLAKQISEFASVQKFLVSRDLLWEPSENSGQDYPEEMRQYLAEAREKWADSAVILAALTKYEREVGDLLCDEEE